MPARKTSKVLAVAMLVLFFSLCFASTAFADQTTKKLLSDEIRSSAGTSGEGIVEIADRGGYAIVSTVRDLAIIALFLLIIWIALLLSGGNEMAIAKAKKVGALALFCLILVFKTESIVVSAFELFGLEDFLK